MKISARWRVAWVFGWAVLVAAANLSAQQPAQPGAAGSAAAKELVAVLDLDIIGSTKEQGAVLTNQLRSELLKTGQVRVVDRSQLERIMSEQALQQAVCTDPACAVRAGKILGARKVVTGTVTKVTDTLWQLSVSMTDAETGEVTRQEVVNHVGDFSTLFLSGMAALAKKLTATSEELAAGVTRLSPQSIAPVQYDVQRAGAVTALALSADNTRLYYGLGSQVLSWQLFNRSAAGAPISVPKGDVTALAISASGDRLVAGSSRGAVVIAELPAGKVIASADASAAVTSVAFSPTGNYFAAGTTDETVVVFYARSGERAYKLDDQKSVVQSVRFSPDGRMLVAAGKDGTVRFYDVNLQKQVRAFQVAADQLHAAEVSRDGAYVGISARKIDIDLMRNRRTDTRFITIRDFKTGEELASIQAHEKDIAGLSFFPDPRFVATGGQDGQVKIWDMQAKSSLANLGVDGRVTALAVSPNGHWLVAADDSGRLTVWEVVK